MPEPWNDVTKATLDVVNHLQRGYLMVPRDAWSVRTMAALRHADAVSYTHLTLPTILLV